MKSFRAEKCSADTLQEALQNKDCQIVDVREGFEFESEKIAGCHHYPLSSLNENALKDLDKNKPVYLVCKSGSRAALAADKFKNFGFQDVYVMEGGLNAWRAAGKPIVQSTAASWSLERQVRFAAGALVLLGMLLALFVDPYFAAISLFVGAGLVFSAVTDTCGMGFVLAKMPWNRPRKKTPASCCGLNVTSKKEFP